MFVIADTQGPEQVYICKRQPLSHHQPPHLQNWQKDTAHFSQNLGGGIVPCMLPSSTPRVEDLSSRNH